MNIKGGNMSIIAVLCDKDNDLKVVEDGFATKELAKKYMNDNNLSDEDYFVEEIEI